jgi:hypothetical protein
VNSLSPERKELRERKVYKKRVRRRGGDESSEMSRIKWNGE